MSDELEEELNIMEERDKTPHNSLELALSVREPIESILFKEPVIVSKTTTLADVIKLFCEKDVSCVVVVENGELTGIFTERDIVRKLFKNKINLASEVVSDYMTEKPEVLKPADQIAYALNKMAAGGYRHIPLVDIKNHPVGILSIKDIIEHLADYYSDEILNLPPNPDIKQRSREGG